MTKLMDPVAERARGAEGAVTNDGGGGPDSRKLGAFMNRMMSDFSGALVSIVCAIGDRLGLFSDLAALGPATSVELAERAGIAERYAREWLNTLTCAGYVEYEPASDRYTLPFEHALALAQEGGPMFLGGGYQQLLGLMRPIDLVVSAFRGGGGIPQTAYDDDLLAGMERMSATWFDHLLVPRSIPEVPGLRGKLEAGATAADVGCGSGRAVIRLAQAFPNSRFVGYDEYEPAVVRATAGAARAGVADRVRFERRNLLDGLPGRFDLITSFDSVHDFRDPLAGLRAVREALRPGGTYLVLEMACSEDLEENIGTVGALLYGTSVLYNLPVSLEGGGAGLGTMGLPESKLAALCAEAGFGAFHKANSYSQINHIYYMTP